MMITSADVSEVLGRWWFSYDEAHFDVLSSLLTDDAHFTCRTDTGTTDFEEFVRADVSGRDAVVAWQTEHRLGSPHPLRHHGTNVHVVSRTGEEATFASYICVTHVVAMMPQLLPAGIVTGRVRRVGEEVLISTMDVVIDTQESVPLSQRVSS
jgi:hypothetical protein